MEKKPHRVEIQDHTVTKYFGNAAAFTRELRVYKLGLPMTPRLLACTGPERITLEKITGTAYLDGLLNENGASRLAQTIARFHAHTREDGKCLCHWDNQPRNILDCNGAYYLIDFAESRISFPEDDITHLMLFWASEFTMAHMEELARAFIAAYTKTIPLDPERWRISLSRSIERFDRRRSLHLHPSHHLDTRLLQGNRELIGFLLDN
jgi:tRNA A-37 threonylcarbamoyl transferase component Bud32